MSSSGASKGSAPGALAGLQNGVLLSGDLLVGTISISSVTGALTFTPATVGSYAFVNNSSGVLTAVAWTAAAQALTPTLPASTKYAVVGVEITSSGVWQLVKGTDTATQLNTAALIASNTPATSSGAMRVADFAYWNNAGTINFGDHTTTATQGTNWIDRRPWARGAANSITITAGNYTTSSSSYVNIDGTNLVMRAECTGNPIKTSLLGLMQQSATATISFRPTLDGSAYSPNSLQFSQISTGTGVDSFVLVNAVVVPAAGTHSFSWQYAVTTGTLTLFATSGDPLVSTLEEIPRPYAGNGLA